MFTTGRSAALGTAPTGGPAWKRVRLGKLIGTGFRCCVCRGGGQQSAEKRGVWLVSGSLHTAASTPAGQQYDPALLLAPTCSSVTCGPSGISKATVTVTNTRLNAARRSLSRLPAMYRKCSELSSRRHYTQQKWFADWFETI